MTGKVLATSRAGVSIDVAGQDWFQAAAAGQPVVTSLIAPRRSASSGSSPSPSWIAAAARQAVVIGDLDPAALADLLNPELSEGNEVIVADDQHQLIYGTEMGEVADDADALPPVC